MFNYICMLSKSQLGLLTWWNKLNPSIISQFSASQFPTASQKIETVQIIGNWKKHIYIHNIQHFFQHVFLLILFTKLNINQQDAIF